MKNVVCYVRVSTENQLENYSIDEQRERLESYCKAMGWRIYRIYTDGGYSGGNMDRPALQEMLNDIKEKKNIESVVVYKLDRLSRSQKDTLTLIEDYFLKSNVDFVSVCENFDTSSPFGKAMIGILSVFAQLEKDQITERFTMGRIGRSKAGYFHGGGNAPKGYDYIDGKLIVNEYEAMQVKEIFELFLNGKSINSIYHYMTDKYGNLWSSASKISNTLKNPIYKGHVRFKGKEYKGIHTPLIDEETFIKANQLLVSPERTDRLTETQKSPFRAGYLLSGMIYCTQCGAKYSANHGYYKCYSRSKSSPKFIVDPDCKNENWKIDELDEIVINQLKHICIEENLSKVINLNVKYTPAENTDALKNQIKEIENRISKLIELYQISEIPIEDIKEKITALSNEKEKLKKQLYNQQNNSVEKKVSDFIKAVEKFRTSFFDSDLDQKRIILSSIIRKINIDGKSIILEWRL